jgi:ATP-binding cassette subfamily C protein
MAYVPQQIRIFEGSIAENITQGLSKEEIQNYDLPATVNASALRGLIDSSQDGLSMQLGANGTKLSGGQAQRIGIARALITNPTLIVFDEATSALDSETESVITETLTYLKGKTTMIIVAHRLSTVQSADVIIYMKEGQIIAKGTFEQVRTMVPNFDKQAQLMGLMSEK